MLVISPASAAASNHVELTRQALADFALGKGAPVKGAGQLAELDRALDRTRLLPPTASTPTLLDAKGEAKCNDGLEH